MPDSACRQMVSMLDAAAALRLPHWGPVQQASVYLYRADMLKGLGDVAGAIKQMQAFMTFLPQLEKSPKVKLDGTIAFGFYMSAFLLQLANNIPLAADHLKKAQAVTGYDQYNQMQVRMHALGQLIKRRKTELGIK
jgi:hypothetical protein